MVKNKRLFEIGKRILIETAYKPNEAPKDVEPLVTFDDGFEIKMCLGGYEFHGIDFLQFPDESFAEEVYNEEHRILRKNLNDPLNVFRLSECGVENYVGWLLTKWCTLSEIPNYSKDIRKAPEYCMKLKK
jgi:hypothetical protein